MYMIHTHTHLGHGLGDGLVLQEHENRVVDVGLGCSHRLEDLQRARDVPGLALAIDVREILPEDRLGPSSQINANPKSIVNF